MYQAYPPEIAGPAAAAGRFVPPFKRERMTWIKPSFRRPGSPRNRERSERFRGVAMMYRCGWATKPGQERVLAVELTRAGFEWALAHACLSHYDRDRYPDRAAWAARLRASPVRVRWDPERSPRLGELPYRSLQVGLSGTAVDSYVDQWTVGITDITPTVRAIRARLDRAAPDGEDEAAVAAQLPAERPYPLLPDLAATIGADAPDGETGA